VSRAQKQYLDRYAEPEARDLGALRRRFGHVLTVPAYGEGRELRTALASIPAGPLGDVLTVLVVNGRIRESVGATHVDMAEILRTRGMQTAMGFDPGGSATLVVDGQTLNISPYNRDYERNVYALEPQPRAVASAVVGY